jgi:SAM-dependent methyltransferase
MTGMSAITCVVCKGSSVERMRTATGERAYCHSCFHGWRTSIDPFAYNATAMCSLGTSDERLLAQVGFFAPFTPAQARILEIGCATGELAAMTRRELSPARYEAIELSPAGAQAAERVDQLFTRTLPTLIAEDAIEPGFDAILMSHVLEHLEDPEGELIAMKRVLAPAGVLFIEVPNLAGHRRLPLDDNRSHLHFFSVTSLTRLLANLGLEVIASATDAWLDARYADSLRVVARPFALPQAGTTRLSDHPALAGDEPIVVWGAGSLTDEMLANFFDAARIDFFVDRNPAKHGTTLLGRPVRSPADIGEAPRTILLNSIDFAPSIAADIQAMYPTAGHRLVPIADLLS